MRRWRPRRGVREIALRRLEASAAILTTTEAALFEWCRSAEHPQFQAILKLVLATGREHGDGIDGIG